MTKEWSRVVRRVVVGMIAVLGLLAGLLAGSPAAQAETPKITTGWLPYWMTSPARPAGINSAVANADLLSEVSPFWYSAMQGGWRGSSRK